MGIRTEPESTVPLEYNRVTVETGEITGTGGTSNADLLAEIQKMRFDLIATTEENRRIQKDALQELESKIEDMKKEMTEKLRSIEASNPQMPSDNSLNMCLKMRIMTERINGHLGLFILCEPISPSDKWSIQTKLEYKVVGINRNVVIRTSERCYQNSTGWGYSEFLGWEEMKKWYLLGGNLTVEVNVTIIETTGVGIKKIRKFDESQKDVSDVILVVRDTKFYVLKTFLASQSTVFKALLLGNFKESKQSEVKLNGIDPDNFQYFLEVLYGESAIDEANVEDIARLADMYDAPTAIRRCEEFLLKESKKTLEKKLEIATRFNLEDLKENCMGGNATTVVPKDSKVSKKNPLRKLFCL